ncbi:putative ankyrin repeat protein RBE_0220 [Mytilus californianus]|uniref:putative ankyrin repeat protein RBE_0220 n=1 Tax=Mytilus californianus TaxID=6549 RepID=UPI0022482B9C|nr:putative ankyrin repeat protein RBE_0220 [Mytilus californianus]
MARLAAVKLGETDNYRVIFESNPTKLIFSIDISTKQIFVIDDIVGKYSLNDYSLQTWRAEANSIKQIITKSLNTKLILTCRSYIYRNEQFSLLKLPHIHCDMLADEIILTEEERRLICRCYHSAEEIQLLHDDVITLYHFLPLICMQYRIQDKNTINDYFIYPKAIIENEMNELRLSSDPCFIALGLLVIFNNSIDKQSLTLYDKNQTTKIRITDVLNDMLQDIDYRYVVSLKAISASLSLLENIYTKETALTFTCINKSMFDMLVETVGRHFIPCILKYSNSGFIKEYVEVVLFPTDGKRHTIKIESRYTKMYFRRIIDDINNGFNEEVFGTVQMKCKYYQVYLLENILEIEKPTLCKSKKDGTTVLHVTVQLGYYDLSSFFVKNDKSLVNSKDNTGKTPLHMACLKGNAVLAKFLIKYNAKVNQMDTDKVTPFMLACRSGEIELIKFLLTQQVHINACNSLGSTPLLEACIQNNVKVFSLLLQNKAKVDCFNKNGDTPLHLACQSGQTEILNLLIKYDIDTCINKPNVKGYTPFYLAISNGHKEIANILFKHGADPKHTNKNEDTPLHLLCQNGQTEIVNLLMKFNVNTCLNKPNGKGFTPFYLALSNRYYKTANILVRYGADPNIPNADGFTPLHIACETNELDLVKTLLEQYHVEFNKEDDKGRTPLVVSEIHKHEDISELLIEREQRDENIVSIPIISTSTC